MSTIIAAEDLYRFQAISGCATSPDGQHIAFTLHRVQQATEKKFSNIWIAPTSGGPPVQFTFGDQRDTQPQWSPDGTEIAYLSNQHSSRQSQLTVIPFHGGAPRPLNFPAAKVPGQIYSFQWSPDGTQFVCAFRKKDQSVIEREADET